MPQTPAFLMPKLFAKTTDGHYQKLDGCRQRISFVRHSKSELLLGFAWYVRSSETFTGGCSLPAFSSSQEIAASLSKATLALHPTGV